MRYFTMNGYLWKVRFVAPQDPMLVDRTGVLTVATTDPNTLTLYIADGLHGSFLTRVLLHELGHCAIFSYGLIDDIQKFVAPEYWNEAEEWACNFIADYGMSIFKAAYKVLGDKAVDIIPRELERMIT